MPEALRDLLSAKDVAARFGVHGNTVRGWADSGALAYIRTPGGQRRYRREDVERLYVQTFGTPAAAS